jgi:hypothetical protein
MNEQWKAVTDFEGVYQVSDLGNVKRVSKGRSNSSKPVGSLVKQENLGGRYCRVSLWLNGVKTRKLVHVLVATAFIGPCPAGMEVNHIDGNGFNNKVSNLEYLTHQGNLLHSARVLQKTPPKGSAHYNTNLTEDDVRTIRDIYAQGKRSQREIGAMYGIGQDTISLIVLRKKWKHVA